MNDRELAFRPGRPKCQSAGRMRTAPGSWDTDQAFTSYGSAIKVREYLATGKPVVISPLPEYEPMRDVLRIAQTRDEFLKHIDDALREDDPEARIKRQAAVREGTWDARAEWVSNLIEQTLATKKIVSTA